MNFQRKVPSCRCTLALAMLGLAPGTSDGQQIDPFRIQVPDMVLSDLQARLARTRWPDQVEGSQWQYGVPLETMKQIIEYWQTKYDWRQHERELNKFEQFITHIDGLDIHFIHVRSKE